MISLNKIKYFLFFAIIFSVIVVPTLTLAQSNIFDPPEPSTNNPNLYNNLFTPSPQTLPSRQTVPNSTTFLPGSTSSSSSSCGEIISGIGGFLCDIQLLLNSVIPILILLGVVYFVWGVVQYFIKDDEEAKKNGRDRIIFGIIALAFIIGIWGLVNLVVNTFGFSNVAAPSLPSSDLGSCSLAGNPTFRDLLCYAARILNTFVVPLIFALTIVVFVWGVVNFFIINAGEEAKREQGKLFMLWGILALAVMLSVWGLVAVLGGTFGIDTSVIPQVKP